MDAIRIFLVEDHDLVRDGLKALLASIPDISIIGEETENLMKKDSCGIGIQNRRTDIRVD